MSRVMSFFVSALVALPGGMLSSDAHAQGIPAVSGALKHTVSETVVEGMPVTLTLTVPDRPAAFYAKCTFGSPAEEVEAESDAMDAGQPFVIALPADTSARSADCAVVARFANGLSERKPVKMRWAVVPMPKEDAQPPAEADAEDQLPPGDRSPPEDAPPSEGGTPAKDAPPVKDAPPATDAPPADDGESSPTR